jgi:hypothetical protein
VSKELFFVPSACDDDSLNDRESDVEDVKQKRALSQSVAISKIISVQILECCIRRRGGDEEKVFDLDTFAEQTEVYLQPVHCTLLALHPLCLWEKCPEANLLPRHLL